MIRNIIFDMGGVLIKYDPDYFVDSLGLDSRQDRDILLKEIFLSEYWEMQDQGIYTNEEVYRAVIKNIPERLHKQAYQLVMHWHDPVIPIEGMAALIREFKESGFGIYLLSNAGFNQPLYWENIPGHEYFDGGVVSAFEKTVKPERRIFEILLDRYQLKAEECIFIDDVEKNCAGARRCGINAVRFDGDVETLRGFLSEMNQKGSTL